MKEYKTQVSIIIVNYNTKDLTKKAIQAVFDKTEGVEYEIIVVDNDSKDGSVEELKKTFQDKIIIIEPKENLGFGRANNLGIKQANGKYVFLLNSDTELINNAIKIFSSNRPDLSSALNLINISAPTIIPTSFTSFE